MYYLKEPGRYGTQYAGHHPAFKNVEPVRYKEFAQKFYDPYHALEFKNEYPAFFEKYDVVYEEDVDKTKYIVV